MLRNPNEPSPADEMLRELFDTPEGREKIRASIVRPILNKMVYRSGWLGLLTLSEEVTGQNWDFQHTVKVAPFVDNVVQSMVAGLDARVGAALQAAFTGDDTPRLPFPPTREAWDEARAGQNCVMMAPVTYNRLRTVDWFPEFWQPSDQMGETRVGWFGHHGPLPLRVTPYMPPDVMLFSSGPIGEVQLGLGLSEQVDRGLIKWTGDLKMTLAKKKIRLHQFPH